jgi:glycosyltransferase involved in cell wall biosynthesis
VAAIDPRKGLDVLIKAVSLIPIELRPNTIINGPIRDQHYMQQLKNMVTNMKLTTWVKFNQGVRYDDLPSLYQSATLFVLPTREDALGVVVLEALHCGLPVIATSVGGLTYMIVNGINGILVKPDDPVELANAILLLLRDKNLRLSLAKNSVKALNSQYYNRLTIKQAFERSIDSLQPANVN